ncbi:BatA and WFA domain-containing protein [Flavobacteriaceae bacterium GSB9]|nr:BatA and WFA domain-containing protein [Flavobacteriaceae bacterium GSB9]
MQFKHPELLYALFLLLIPIIVHLFQLRKFQKVDFTNVAFLKAATMQTRKSSQIKKWLILLTRMLLLATLVFAFAQPFTTKNNSFKTEKETVIYLDNSFSMQAKGKQGVLFKRAIQDLITNIPEDENVTIITNNSRFKNTSIKAIKNDLLQMEYSANTISTEAALLKSKSAFSNKNGIEKNIVLISDFQGLDANFRPEPDSTTQLNLVKLEPVNRNNIWVDSAFISKKGANGIDLNIILRNSGTPIDNFPISLFNNDTLIAKTSVSINKRAETIFSIPANEVINGKITINDANLPFDNTLFFNINKTPKINVLAINAADDSFLKRLYTDDEFNYSSTQVNQLDFNLIDSQHLIVLNELDDIPLSLSVALQQFAKQDGAIVIIPSKNINTESYNQFLANYNNRFSELNPTEKRVTTINYGHPLFKNGVFEKQVKNFQYPSVNSFYKLALNTMAPVLQFEDGAPFLVQSQNVYVFTSALNQENSSFQNSQLIVPTLYNIGRQSHKTPELYYTIGNENTFDIETQMQQDAVLSLIKDEVNIIPKQQYFNNKVVVYTSETPDISGIYAVKNKNKTVKNLSYNYNRDESNLNYKDLSALKNVTVSNSFTKTFDALKSDSKVNALWKWFVIFALALLLIEMLILKFFK